jgi:hypothetical protein
VTYHNHELGHDLFDDDDAEDEDEGGEGDGGEQPNQPIVNLEIKPPKLAEEEAIEPVDISEVHKLGQWHGLAIPTAGVCTGAVQSSDTFGHPYAWRTLPAPPAPMHAPPPSAPAHGPVDGPLPMPIFIYLSGQD